MQITHEQARRLIQFHADETLNEAEKISLEGHLNTCIECQKYAGNVQELGSILRPLLQKRWNREPLPHPSTIQTPRRKSKVIQDILLATRIAAMGLICMAVLINIWQFTQWSTQEPGGPSASVPPVPTPSLHTTSTMVTTLACEQILYPVQENDTLESIAGQFSVSTQEILNLNELSADQSLNPPMVLRIPLCKTTPAGTPHTAAPLFTPLINTTTTTPVGSPTQ